MADFIREQVSLGNTFDSTKASWGHAKKVWRAVREVVPAGGTINGVEALFKGGTTVIKAGTPVKFDEKANTMDVISISAIESAADVSALGINGFLYRDIPLASANTIATGDVVVNGDIYDFAFTEAAAAKIKAMPQTNGMKIRVVH